MSDKKKIKERTCLKCHHVYEYTAVEIKKHDALCEGPFNG